MLTYIWWSVIFLMYFCTRNLEKRWNLFLWIIFCNIAIFSSISAYFHLLFAWGIERIRKNWRFYKFYSGVWAPTKVWENRKSAKKKFWNGIFGTKVIANFWIVRFSDYLLLQPRYNRNLYSKKCIPDLFFYNTCF